MSSKQGAALQSEDGPVATAQSELAAPSNADQSGIQRAYANFIEMIYQSHGCCYDKNMAKLEEGVGLKREFLFFGLFGLFSLYLMFGENACFACNFCTFLMPAYASMMGLKTGDQDLTNHMLAYWILYGMLAVIDNWCYQLPLYFFIKAVALIFFAHPETKGAVIVYKCILVPVFDFLFATC